MFVSFMKKNEVRSLFVFLAAFLIYFLLPNQNFTHDCLDYAIAVRDGKYLFHPHHFLYNAFGRLCFLLFSVDALKLLQTISALSMALCIGLIHHTFLSRKNNTLWVYFFACCNAVIFCGTSPEMYSITMLFTFGSWIPYLLKKVTNTSVLYAALSAALSMLFHQTAIFSVMILGLAYYKRNKVHSLLFMAVSFFITVGMYIYAASINGCTDLHSFIKWLTEYTHLPEASGGAWGKFSLYTIPQAMWGIVSTISYPEFLIGYFVNGNVNPSPWDAIISSLSILLCIVFLFVAFRLIYPNKISLRDRIANSESIFVILWFLLQVLFTVWWEPSNNEFWVLCLLPFVIFISGKPLRKNKKIIFSFILVLSFVNFTGRANKDSQQKNNTVFTIIKQLDESKIKDEDIVLTFYTELKPYMEYFYHKKINVISLGRMQNSGVEKQSIINKYKKTLDSLNTYHSVFILENEINPDNITLTYYTQWTASDYTECYTSYNDRMEIVGYYQRFGRTSKIYKLKPFN